jgi:hypothetical protein
MLVKYCDNCQKKLGGDEPFNQIRGSIAEQIEPENGTGVRFRYLSERANHTFCDDECEMEWRDHQRSKKGFRSSDYA